MGAYGLQTHIWNNNLKSIILLAGFPVLLLVLLYALSVGYVALSGNYQGTMDGLVAALEHVKRLWPYALLSAAVWFLIAWFSYHKIIAAAVGARRLAREDAPRVYNLLENLCISRGVTTPRLDIVETPALNAFASGLAENSYKITVTRGLVEHLDDDELEAVLAHELTHIQNRDVRLLIIAVIFVGIFSFFGELIFNGLFRRGVRIGGHTRSRSGDSRGGGGLILIAVALIAIAYILAIAIRFALSQKREYLADAGAAELTRNPGAMVRALEKISRRSDFDAPSDVQQMMVENRAKFAGVFATHPPIEKRIAALRNFAGAPT